ncbi:MAG: hypothetical protein KC503_28035 [Myxococcales bacterium]|nr:hypothetical protein [Myxococcales bacterium]
MHSVLIRLCLAFVITFSTVGCGGRPAVSSGDSGPSPDSAPSVLPPTADSGPGIAPGCTDKPTLTLLREGEQVIARLTNTTCKPLWRVQGCCGEGEPLVEAPRDDGTWGLAKCAKTGPMACCDGMPTCDELAPGASVDIQIGPLRAALCCGTTFRVRLPVYGAADCFNRFGPVQEIASNALKLRDKDTCTFPKTNCGDTFCDATSEVCAEVQPQSSPPRKACQAVPPQCSNDHSCGCVGKAVCGTGIYTCIDVNAENTVLCTCPNC